MWVRQATAFIINQFYIFKCWEAAEDGRAGMENSIRSWVFWDAVLESLWILMIPGGRENNCICIFEVCGKCLQEHCWYLENTILFLFIIFFCSEFCHTLKWNSHGFTCVPHPDPPSYLPLHPIPLGLPSAPGPSACLMHPTWAGDLFHPR